jgi:hypothetical protein
MSLRRRRRVRRSRGLDEAHCYLRCHGMRMGQVEVLPATETPPRGPRFWYWARPANPRITGEELRRQFAERLAKRTALEAEG